MGLIKKKKIKKNYLNFCPRVVKNISIPHLMFQIGIFRQNI